MSRQKLPPVCWPDRELLSAVHVTTPLLAVSLTQVRHAAMSAHAAHASRGLNWLPLIPRPALVPIIGTLCANGATGVTCQHLREAMTAAKANSPSVMILLPPVSGIGPELVAELAGRTAVSIVVDHFAQAERLAEACNGRSSSIDLLIRIDVGRERLGVRPGPDLHDLARGVANLPGVRLAGIAVEASTVGTCGVATLSHDELARLLERCHRSLTRAGIAGETVSISRLRDAESMDGSDDPSVIRIATHARTPLDEISNRPSVVLAGVVGRPTRHQAVIDAGRDWLGAEATVAWPDDSGIRVTAIDDTFAVLHVPSDSHGLVIGDLVALVPGSESRLNNSHVILEDNGHWQPLVAGASPTHTG